MAESRLSYRAWQIVDPLLPTLDRDWGDNCEKLRRSILSLFDARKWPIEDLWKLLQSDDHLFSDMARTAKQFVVGRAVFNRLILEIETRRLSATWLSAALPAARQFCWQRCAARPRAA